MYYIGVRDGKKEKWKKKAKIKSQNLSFLSHNILGPSQGVYKIWRLAVIRAENSVMKSFIGEKEKWTNKGNDKQQHADCLLHNTTTHTQHLYQISYPMFSSSWEIFDEKKKFTHIHTHTQTHTHTITEKTKNISDSEQSSHTPSHSYQRYVETIL